MKLWNRLLILGTAGCLILSGCGKNIEEGTINSTTGAPPSPSAIEVSKNVIKETSAVADEESWNPSIIQRQLLADEGAMCGVIFLGYVDESVGDLKENRDYYQSRFEKLGYMDGFPFFEELPDSNIVQTEHGQELYVIIPEDPGATVSINQWITDADKGFEGKTGDVLYRSEEGTPILLKCNASELVSDVELVIVDSDGDQMKWYPALSLMDGFVFVEPAEGAVYDFTFYDVEYTEYPLNVMVGQGMEFYWDEEYETTLAKMFYPYVKLDIYEEQTYPELVKNLNANMEAREAKIYEDYEGKIETARTDYPDTLAYLDHFQEYESSESAMVRRADTSVLSILYKGFQFEGGVHGYTYYWGENYDTKTGSLLTLTDVVEDIGEFSGLIKEQLYSHWEEESFYADLDFEQYFKENLDTIPWTLDYNGITVFFNPYEIAPYANGVYVATIAFDANPELFNGDYVMAPESYGMQLDLNTLFYYDVDADGELDEILVYGTQDEYGYMIHNVHVDQESYSELDEDEIYAYNICEPHLIHMADGKNYLMIENLTDNDYRTTTLYELTSGTPVKLGHVLSGMHVTADHEADRYYKEVLSDPYDFRMDTRTWCLGTYDGYQTYYIDMDGQPVSYEDYYTFDNMPEFTVKKDFDLKIVDEYGEIGETFTVKAGEQVTYYHTDSSQFADFILSDGRIGRAELEWYEGSCSINGIAVENLFDGIVFAG